MTLAFQKAVLTIVAFASMGAVGHAQTEVTATLVHNGLTREYVIYTPANLTPKAPVVFVLHGGGGNASQIQAHTDFDTVADQYGFIVVYPNGIDGAWMDGREFREESHDDVGFFAALIDQVIADYDVDPERVFVTGISNGGFMSFQLACRLSSRIAGISAVTATLANAIVESCQPEKPIAVLIMNGTDDPLVPYDGGSVTVFGTQRGEILSTDDTVAFWTTFNQCSDTPSESALPNAAPLDRTRVHVTEYQDCEQPVSLYRVEGGGHTWPGASQYLPVSLIVVPAAISTQVRSSGGSFHSFKKHLTLVPHSTHSPPPPTNAPCHQGCCMPDTRHGYNAVCHVTKSESQHGIPRTDGA